MATEESSSSASSSLAGNSKSESGYSTTRVVLYAVLVLLGVGYLIPLESGLMTAFKTNHAFTHTVPLAPPLPSQTTMHAWNVAFNTLSGGFLNSFLLVIPATVLSAFFGSITAYGLTVLDWKHKAPVILLVVAGIFIPYQSVLVPVSRFFSILNLRHLLGPVWVLPGLHTYDASLLALIIAHTAYGIPITTLLFRSHYKNLSTEMLEAARLDGASAYTLYRRVVLPLSMSMFVVTFIYQFTQIWNNLLLALIIIPSGSGPASVVTLKLLRLTGGVIQSFNTEMAGAFLAAIPTLIVYVVFGDQFARGVASQ